VISEASAAALKTKELILARTIFLVDITTGGAGTGGVFGINQLPVNTHPRGFVEDETLS
jgi:hypothetical protein